MNLQTENFVLNNYIFNRNEIGKIQKEKYSNNYPIVYIIYDLNSKRAYVGESTNATNRMKNHLSNPDKKKLEYVYIISSPLFNKSAALDIESNLIKYMSGDNSFSLLNGNAGVVEHNYYQRDLYFDIFKNIWKGLKFNKVVSKDIIDITNSDLFKYSPYKSLSQDQNRAIIEYLEHICNNSKSKVFIEGSAGTGKTILAVYLMKLLASDFNVDDYDKKDHGVFQKIEAVQKIKDTFGKLSFALVVPMTSLRETLKKVLKSINGLSANMVIGPSDVLKKKYDLLIVDEAHRLRRRKSITNYRSFDDNNRKLGLDKELGTELDWVLLQSKHQLFFYDSEQSVKPSDVLSSDFSKVRKLSTTIKLKSQMRAQGGSDYIDYVHDLLNPNNSKVLERFEHENYELRLFEYLPEMISLMKEKEKQHGLCRMVAGYSWKWISRDSNVADAKIDGVDLFWNKVGKDWINSTTDMNEMGCIHTTQGYDLNYAGIIFGKEIVFNDKTGMIEIIKENYHDAKGKQGVYDPEELKNYLIKIYKTMMYRGIKGTFVYCCDEKLRKYFSQYMMVN